MKTKSNKIAAVFKEELGNLLSSLGELESIKAGERSCYICSKTITPDNLQLIVPKANNKFQYVCNDTSCIAAYNQNKSKLA